MSYRIEAGKVIFQEAPREGAEVEVIVSKVNTLKGFSDPRGFYPRRVNEADTNRLAVNDLMIERMWNLVRNRDLDRLVAGATGDESDQRLAAGLAGLL